jgi:type 1 fimbria pilin
MSQRKLGLIGLRSLVALSFALSFMAKAVLTTITVKVSVVAPACVINDNKAIEVEFGDVMTTRVDGSNYRMPVNYTLDCGAESNNAMKLQVQGNGAGFNSEVLQTTVPDLGIRLQNGTTTLPINTWVNFTYPTKPELWAVPVKAAGATLSAGEFTAASTMRVDYQ